MVFDGQKALYIYSNRDALITTTALVHELGAMTRNTADFERAGLRLLNPWELPQPIEGRGNKPT